MARKNEISPTGEWVIIRRMIETRIHELRDQLEASGYGADQDNKLRGEIAGLRWLVTEIEPAKPVAEPAHYFPAHGHS
jgi:hypothetical protein